MSYSRPVMENRKPSRYKGREERTDRGRQHHGKMIPVGTSTMSDEEFWGQVDITMAASREQRLSRSGTLHGKFPYKATNKQMAEYS